MEDTNTSLHEWAADKVALLLAEAFTRSAVVLYWLSDLEGWEE